MTIDPQWQLLKAAESALIRLVDAANALQSYNKMSGLAHECVASVEYLRDAIEAVELQKSSASSEERSDDE